MGQFLGVQSIVGIVNLACGYNHDAIIIKGSLGIDKVLLLLNELTGTPHSYFKI